MNISALSDEELNRAMVWLNPNGLVIYSDSKDGIRNWGYSIVNYLTDWSLTGPLAQKNDISMLTDNVCGWYADQHGHYETVIMSNPLRAICECYLAMRLAE